MKEAKSPKKPLIFYYGVLLAVLLAFNMIVSPLLLERHVGRVPPFVRRGVRDRRASPCGTTYPPQRPQIDCVFAGQFHI